ncbi:hypothetical protein JCM9279_005405 [Rhodotorula babjevae]
MSAPTVYPRASLLGLPRELLANVVDLAASSPLYDDDRTPHDRHKTVHKVAQTCTALHGVAKPLRRRHVVLSGPTTTVQPDEHAHYVHIKSRGAPVVISGLSMAFGNLRSLRLYLGSSSTVDLALLANLPHLRRLTISGGQVTGESTPLDLIELELLDVKCEPALAHHFIVENKHLRTVHITQLRGDRDHYIPGEALIEHGDIEFLQVGPQPIFYEASFESLLRPYVAELAESLAFVYSLDNGAITEPFTEHLRRLIVHYPDPDEYDKYNKCEVGSDVPVMLGAVAGWVDRALSLEAIALPRTCRPTAGKPARDDLFDEAVQLAFNSIMNACRREGVEILFYDERVPDLSACRVALCDELRTGWSLARGLLDTSDEPLPEWPGSWQAFMPGGDLDAYRARSPYGSHDEEQDEYEHDEGW